jgi:glucokinase
MKRILAADIGGTNSRFASFTTNGLSLVLEDMLRLPTKHFGSFLELVDALEGEGFPASLRRSDVTVIAVAGAVRERVYAKPPNIPWEIDFSHGREIFGEGGYFLINDFVAQAFGCQTDAASGAREIKPGTAQEDAALAAIGAGTGLGHCALLPDLCGGYIAAPSEAGHASFAFLGPEEQEYERFLLAKTGKPYAYGDIVVTGLGLSLLHGFLTGEDLDPAGVSARLTEDCATTAWFARFYGRACRNYALSVLAMRGVHVVGGVAAKNPMLVMHPHFRQEFVESPNYGWLLREIPVYLNDNEDSGLWGAAFYGLLSLR